MVKKTKGSLSSSSSGAWLFLFLGVALLLLPSTLGAECVKADSKPQQCTSSNDKYCVKTWFKSAGDAEAAVPLGCFSEKEFLNKYGFKAPENGCGPVPPPNGNKGGEVFACACNFQLKWLCNEGAFGEGDYKKWKEAKNKEKNKDKGQGSAGLLAPFPLLPLTLTLAALTLGAFLAC